MRSRPDWKTGFTLLEVLVALVLIGIAVLMISRLFSRDMRAVAYSSDYTYAVAAAQSKMREVLAEDPIQEGFSHDSSNGYDYDISISNVLGDKTEILNCRLLEVDLTVHWMSDSKNKSFTLRTLKEVKKKP